ncbi:MAG: CZB domain-containing protein, partial [Candidatus Krumholzibacteriia bacterium]
MMSHWSLSRKIGAGFGTVLVLLGGLAAMSFQGVGAIVDDAEEVIHGNELKAMIVQRELDHLRWSDKVNAFITDPAVTELKAQIDPHQCNLGVWYYGDERAEAERLAPGLATVLTRLEEPHRRMHESAAAIDQAYVPVDLALGAFLREAKVAHLDWAGRVKDVFFDPAVTKLDVVTDPHQCMLGKWFYGDEARALAKADPAFAKIWEDLDWEHGVMHGGAIRVDEMLAMGDRDEAARYVLEQVVPAGRKVIEAVDRLIAWDAARLAGAREAARIYRGVALGEKLLEVDNLYDPRNINQLHHINQALKA